MFPNTGAQYPKIQTASSVLRLIYFSRPDFAQRGGGAGNAEEVQISIYGGGFKSFDASPAAALTSIRCPRSCSPNGDDLFAFIDENR